MLSRKNIERYVKKFKSEIRKYLIEGISVDVHALFSPHGGVLKIYIHPGKNDRVTYDGSFPDLNSAVKASEQKSISIGPGVTFQGTNKIFEGTHIFFIKDSSGKEWATEKAVSDVADILNLGRKHGNKN